MIEFDGTPNKERLGANAILGCSLAVAQAAAADAGCRSTATWAARGAHRLPVPLMNILNGGAHADNSVDLQEFMVAPVGARTFADALRIGRRGLRLAQDGPARARAGHRRWATRAASRPTSGHNQDAARSDRRGDREGRLHAR